MNTTPSSDRLHITLFGLRNAGKSSLINALAERNVAIVSDKPGTTTDPVSKAMELGELGPVVLTDTAGLDDEGELGALRVKKSLERLAWTDIGLFVTPLHLPPHEVERQALEKLALSSVPLAIAATHADLPAHPLKASWIAELKEARLLHKSPLLGVVSVSAKTGSGVRELRHLLAKAGTAGLLAADGKALSEEGGLLEGLAEPGDHLVLVTPIDAAAPKGRLILPQVQVLRDALDRGCFCTVVQPAELPRALSRMTERPRLVITDSQAFREVAWALPPDQALTSFSILFARRKGELGLFRAGLERLEQLRQAAAGMLEAGRPLRLLGIEACTHSRTHEDIATVKIPRLLEERTGRTVALTMLREVLDMPIEGAFDLAVVCGGCMITRRRMLTQLARLEEAGIPAVNFGLFLAWAHGLFPRAVLPLGESVSSLLTM